VDSAAQAGLDRRANIAAPNVPRVVSAALRERTRFEGMAEV
jgi:hypothetical protein